MAQLSSWFGRLLDLLMALACCLLLMMTAMIGFDVLSRNIGAGGFPVSNEFSEDILYLITIMAAPWLLRQGQHIRVDIVLRIFPLRVARALEWFGDVVGLLCSLYFVWYGFLITKASFTAGALNIKTLVTPEWWTLAPLPIAFALVAMEFVFRMHRLATSETGVRDDAISPA
jgi:TRAP-type C4-dicarboxylate transport system permease small subunit